jgi:enediyne biosynthesis protein E4
MGSYGWHVVVKEGKDFNVKPASESGFFIKGEIRDIQGFQSPVGRRLVVGRNNQKLGFFDIQP